jgi:iron complex outermembrane receptor protein
MAAPSYQLPLVVTTFNEAFIDDQHAYDLYDIVKWAPGINEDNISPQGWARYNMRGFTQAAVQRNGYGSYRFIDTSNVERVEVVKGPSSLLYGQITPGGVINYITKRPERRAEAELDLMVGTRGFRKAVIDINQPLTPESGVVTARMVAMAEEMPRFRELDRGTKSMFSPSLRWQVNERLSLVFEYEHFERLDNMLTSGVILRYTDKLPGLPYAPLPRDFSYAGEGDYQDFVTDALLAELNWQLIEGLDLRASYADAAWDMEWRATGQGGTGLISQEAIDAFYPPEAGLTPADAMYRRNRWENQWGGERSAQVDLVATGSLWAWQYRALLGSKRNFKTYDNTLQANTSTDPTNPFYQRPWDLRNPGTWDRNVPFGLDVLTPTSNTSAVSDASSLYGVLSAQSPDERLHVLGGIAHHTLRNRPTIDRIENTTTPSSRRTAAVPQLGLNYRITPGISAFASYSESFQANATLLLVDNVPTTPAKPSIGRGSEAGIKFRLFDGRFSGSLSGYRIKADPSNVLYVTTGLGENGRTLFSQIQGGAQLSEGLELEAMYSPHDSLQIMLGFSTCNAVYTEHPTNRAWDGAPLVATPDESINLWVRYAPQDGPWSNFVFAGGINHVGEFSHAARNPLVRLPSYTTMDLTVGYRFEQFGRPFYAEAAVKNLTDQEYISSASSWGFPRRLIFQLKTKF